MYTTYVRPHIEFSTPAWNPYLQQDQEVIENVQKRAVTMISGLCSNNYEDMLKELRIFSLKDKRIQFDMVQTFKIVHEIDRVVHEIDRVDRKSLVEFAVIRGERVTQLSVDPLNIKSKLSNTELKRRFFSNRVVQQWNDLPKELKNSKSVGSFKSQYTQWKHRQCED